MKVRVCYTIDIEDETRRGLSRYFGKPGLASRRDLQRWLRENGESSLPDLQCEGEDQREDAIWKDTP